MTTLSEHDGSVIVWYNFCDTRFDKFEKNYVCKKFEGDMSGIPYNQRKNFIYFLSRCKRYYKDKKLPGYVYNLTTY